VPFLESGYESGRLAMLQRLNSADLSGRRIGERQLPHRSCGLRMLSPRPQVDMEVPCGWMRTRADLGSQLSKRDGRKVLPSAEGHTSATSC
jgi:hypothetical protein